MRQMGSVSLIGLETVDWNGNTFGSLLGFVAQLSVGLWSLVILTAVIRFVCISAYRRSAERTALVECGVASSAEPATAGEIDQTQQVAGHLTDAGLVRPALPESAVHVLDDPSTKA